jgi:hypothetical protein
MKIFQKLKTGKVYDSEWDIINKKLRLGKVYDHEWGIKYNEGGRCFVFVATIGKKRHHFYLAIRWRGNWKRFYHFKHA